MQAILIDFRARCGHYCILGSLGLGSRLSSWGWLPVAVYGLFCVGKEHRRYHIITVTISLTTIANSTTISSIVFCVLDFGF